MDWKAAQKRSNAAISPAISTVIMTGVMVALITVALSFASNFLLFRMAESEFSSARQFMQTLGLQIDDVAWVIGNTETARYTSSYGYVAFEQALNYTIYINTTTLTNFKLFTETTGIICFNMPASSYSIHNEYYEHIYPATNDGFLLEGTSAPTARIHAIEKLPMLDGNFIRVVATPTIRMLNLSVGNTDYIRLYLPVLSGGSALDRSDSVTLTGKSVAKTGETVTGVKIELNFPLNGFDNFFFRFPQTEETILPDGEAVLELYVGEVEVGLGMHA